MIHKSLLISGLALALLPSAAKAQMQVNAGAPLYIGPGGIVAVLGGDVILNDDVTGTGQLILNGSVPQSIGGVAGKSVSPQLVINNGTNVTLSSLLRIAGDLTFASGKLVAGNNNLIFTSTGTSSGYGESQNRYVVTNGTGFCMKEGLASGSSFTFPIGRSITTGDYNQAVLTNSAATTRDFSVQVKNKAESGVVSGNATRGIDRFWNIYSSAAGTASVALQHKASEAGANFTNNSAYVTQRLDASGKFSVGTNMPATSPTYTHTGSFTVPAASGVTSQFSKSNDTLNSITPFIGVSPVALLEGAFNTGTGQMTNTLNTSGVLQSLAPSQPYNTAPYNYAGTESVGSGFFAAHPTITDWVLVELRNAATPATVVATRAAFINQDGTIVDIDGVSPVYFQLLAPGSYHIAVRHRNHLAIRTSNPQTFTADNATAYNFTTAQTQAYQDPAITSNPAMVIDSTSGKYRMWGGDITQNGQTRYSGPGNDNVRLLNTILGGNTLNVLAPSYSPGDVNMNGVTRYSGPGNDDVFLLNTVLFGNILLVLNQHL